MNINKQFIKYNMSARNECVKYIVVHDTGDPSATAQNEHDYFSGGDRGASADYFVDTNNIIQIIDTDNYYSWHCGDGGGAYGITNRNSLGIEMCLESNGYPSDATVQNTVDLTRYLMSKYNVGIDKVVRHYDASRKSCPDSFKANNWAKWTDFKNKVASGSTLKYGWNQDDKGWWFCTDTTNKYYYRDCWQLIEGSYYLFNHDGYALQSKWYQNSDGHWFYLKNNCVMARNEWFWVDGECYYASDNGAIYQNSYTPDGYWCDKDGAWDNTVPKK